MENQKLEIKSTLTHYVDSFDLARYLSSVVGKEYEVIGSSNDTDYSVEIYTPNDPKVQQYSWYRSDDDEIKELLEDDYIDLECGSFKPSLQYLADKGLVPYGSYVVRVSW